MREVHMRLQEVKVVIKNKVKYESDVEIAVKVFSCGTTYDVEINYYIDGEHQGTFCSDVYSDERKSMIRAKSVLNSVKSWFEGYDDIAVIDSIELYS